MNTSRLLFPTPRLPLSGWPPDMPHSDTIRGVMSEFEYDAAREKLKQTFGDNRQQAGARWEQELALNA